MSNGDEVTEEGSVVKKQENFSNDDLKPLFRGEWVDNLVEGQIVPVGGNLFTDNFTQYCVLDFGSFADKCKNFTSENIRSGYERDRAIWEKWAADLGKDVDPYLYYQCMAVQKVTNSLLQVSNTNEESMFERETQYKTLKQVPLSSFIGKSACAERALLGKYLMQKIGLECSYVSGITMNDANDEEEYPEEHSFIVTRIGEASFVFDVARPLGQEQKTPSIFRMDVDLNYDLFKDKQNLMVEGTELLNGYRCWFGVGRVFAGKHNIARR